VTGNGIRLALGREPGGRFFRQMESDRRMVEYDGLKSQTLTVFGWENSQASELLTNLQVYLYKMESLCICVLMFKL